MNSPWTLFVRELVHTALGYARRMLVHSATAWVFLGASLLVTACAWYISERSVRLRLHDRFELRTDEVGLAIRDRIASYETVLHGGTGLFGLIVSYYPKKWTPDGRASPPTGYHGGGRVRLVRRSGDHAGVVADPGVVVRCASIRRRSRCRSARRGRCPPGWRW